MYVPVDCWWCYCDSPYEIEKGIQSILVKMVASSSCFEAGTSDALVKGKKDLNSVFDVAM